MNQMARRIIRDSSPHTPFGKADANLNQELRNIPNPVAEIFGTNCVSMVTSKQLFVFLHRRPAPRCVDDDPIGATREKRIDVLSRKLSSHLKLSGVRVQRAATSLPAGVQHLAVIPRQHTLRGAVSLAKESLHHTTTE